MDMRRVGDGPTMLGLAALGDGPMAAARTIVAQAHELMLRHIRAKEARRWLYAVLYSERVMLVYDLTALQMFELPEGYIKALRTALAGRRMVYRTSASQAAVVMVVSYAPAASARLAILPAFEGRQVVVYGPTGSGKTSAVQHLLRGRGGRKVILDPHYAAGKGKWGPEAYVVGAGRQFGQIETALAQIVQVMEGRYQALRDGHEDFEALTVAVDELSAFANKIPAGAQHLITLAQEGRKVKIYTILTPHSPEVKQLGFEGQGGARDNFVFIRMPVVRPGEEHRPRAAEVYYGNPMQTAPDGKYLVPAPQFYQGEPVLVAELTGVLGVSAGVSAGVSETGHGPDMGEEAFWGRYARGSDEALALAVRLAEWGYGIRKISELLPYQAAEARQTAALALGQAARGERPGVGSAAEVALVRELNGQWGVPVNRLARLLDGADHENIGRVEAMLSSGNGN